MEWLILIAVVLDIILTVLVLYGLKAEEEQQEMPEMAIIFQALERMEANQVLAHGQVVELNDRLMDIRKSMAPRRTAAKK